ncbi:MAG: UvrD-helicase domain-containing protein [Thermoanaerobaculia bacterium]
MHPIDFQNELNPEQLSAVTHGEGPQLVLAGAGSGKTRVITYRVAWLVREVGIDPTSIVAVTFTNKAAGEMKERVERLLELQPLPTFVGTFHRFSLRLLRRHGQRVGVRPGFAIFDTDDQITMVKRALEEENLAESSFQPRAVLGAISAAKNRLLDPQTFEAQADGFFQRRVAQVYKTYQQMLVRSSGVDFDDMLRLSVQLLAENEDLRERLHDRIHYLLVDEFQDTNHAQMRMVREIVGEGGNLTAVGDEDQGIYRWRGADLDNVLSFEDIFPGAELRKLERNYRSTQTILSVAGKLVAHNRKRREKTLWTDGETGEKVEPTRRDDQDEARWCRTARQPLRPLAAFGHGHPGAHQRPDPPSRRSSCGRHPLRPGGSGPRVYERLEIKDLLAYSRLLRNPGDNFRRCVSSTGPPGDRRCHPGDARARSERARRILWEAFEQSDFASVPSRSACSNGSAS